MLRLVEKVTPWQGPKKAVKYANRSNGIASYGNKVDRYGHVPDAKCDMAMMSNCSQREGVRIFV
jgi:hypothetical protein